MRVLFAWGKGGVVEVVVGCWRQATRQDRLLTVLETPKLEDGEGCGEKLAEMKARQGGLKNACIAIVSCQV